MKNRGLVFNVLKKLESFDKSCKGIPTSNQEINSVKTYLIVVVKIVSKRVDRTTQCFIGMKKKIVSGFQSDYVIPKTINKKNLHCFTGNSYFSIYL